MGCFNTADDRGEAIEATIEYIIYKQPTPKERDLLMKYGLLDKVLWKDSDIKKAEAIIEFCNANLHFSKNQIQNPLGPLPSRWCEKSIDNPSPFI